MELLAFLASLEANKKNRNHVDAQFDVEEVLGKRMLFDGISWNVRRLNYPFKRGSVRWVLRRYSCDVAILLESKLEEVDRKVILSL